jgi:hypothetical protein
VGGLDTNALPWFTILTPTNGSVNMATNPVFKWTGLNGFSWLNVVASTPVQQNFGAFLDPAVTNWSAPKLNYGTNQFFVNYSNALPSVSFSAPIDVATGQSLSNWTATAAVYPSAGSTFVVGAPAPLPVHLGSLQRNGANFQFSFETLAGRPHILQGTTNLAVGPWVDITNFIGDGSLQSFAIPNTNVLRYFRVITQ